MPVEPVRDRTVASRRLRKALEFFDASRTAHETKAWDAAVANAVLAGIAACDAYMVKVYGVRATGQDHREGVRLLRKHGGPDVGTQASALDRLLAMKSKAEYTDRLSTEHEAREAVKRADRLLAWAKMAVEGD